MPEEITQNWKWLSLQRGQDDGEGGTGDDCFVSFYLFFLYNNYTLKWKKKRHKIFFGCLLGEMTWSNCPLISKWREGEVFSRNTGETADGTHLQGPLHWNPTLVPGREPPVPVEVDLDHQTLHCLSTMCHYYFQSLPPFQGNGLIFTGFFPMLLATLSLSLGTCSPAFFRFFRASMAPTGGVKTLTRPARSPEVTSSSVPTPCYGLRPHGGSGWGRQSPPLGGYLPAGGNDETGSLPGTNTVN